MYLHLHSVSLGGRTTLLQADKINLVAKSSPRTPINGEYFKLELILLAAQEDKYLMITTWSFAGQYHHDVIHVVLRLFQQRRPRPSTNVLAGRFAWEGEW